MGLGAGMLDPTDPGLYRVQRGRQGADLLMAPDVGMGGRYVITTGDAHAVNGGVAALPNTWARILDPHSHSFAVLVLGVALMLILGRISLGGTIAAGARAGVK
jgi:hypothetical protein